MKKILYFITVLSILSCQCNHDESGRYLIDDSDKAYLINYMSDIKYVDQNGVEIIANFWDPRFQLEQSDVGMNACSYDTTEYGNQEINVGNYNGTISLHHYPYLQIMLEDGFSQNYLKIMNQIDINLDHSLQNIAINGMEFQNVLVLENTNKHGAWSINKILYSKENGIEFILFADDTWYKRVE